MFIKFDPLFVGFFHMKVNKGDRAIVVLVKMGANRTSEQRNEWDVGKHTHNQLISFERNRLMMLMMLIPCLFERYSKDTDRHSRKGTTTANA